MTLLAEKCNFEKSPAIEDVIRLLAFTTWAQRSNPRCIQLVSDKGTLAQALGLWCKKNKILFEWKKCPKTPKKISLMRAAYFSLPRFAQALGWLFLYLIKRLPFKGTGLKRWREPPGNILFVSYLLNLLPRKFLQGKFSSYYWGSLPEFLQKNNHRTKWLHHYVSGDLLPNPRKATECIQIFNRTAKGTQDHAIVDTFLSLKVISLTFQDWVKIGIYGLRYRKSLKKSLGYLYPALIEDWKESFFGITAIGNALILNLMEAAMELLPKSKLGFYLQENQPWEAALIHSWKMAGHGSLVGVPHTAVRFWDLRYFSDPRTYQEKNKNNIPRPDFVAVNGLGMKKEILKGNYPKNQIIEAEALRYLNLKSPKYQSAKKTKKNKKLRLLILGDYLQDNNLKMLKLLATAISSRNKNVSITLKPHPACLFSLKSFPDLKIKLKSQPVPSLLKQHDIVYTSPVTAASLEAYSYGLPVISLLDPTSLQLSPLRNLKNVYFVKNSQELARVIEMIQNKTKRKQLKKPYFFINKNLIKWVKILKKFLIIVIFPLYVN